MVTIRYDAGDGEPRELEPVDNDFEYVASGDYRAVKVGEVGDDEIVKWIPTERLYEIQGSRTRIRPDRP